MGFSALSLSPAEQIRKVSGKPAPESSCWFEESAASILRGFDAESTKEA
jgi:hypothetical protein